MTTHNLTRARWAAVGAAVAVSIGVGGISFVNATSPTGATTYVSIAPCRVADTRAGEFNIGTRDTPIRAGETHVIAGRGDSGQCVGIPSTATGLQLNVTSLNATAGTFLSVWGSGRRPNASSLNPQPNQPPIPNAVTTGLSTRGAFSVFNKAGSVDVIVDVVGYYADHDHDDRYYTEAESNNALGTKANAADVFTKSEVNTALGFKADSASVYSKAEVDALLPIAVTVAIFDDPERSVGWKTNTPDVQVGRQFPGTDEGAFVVVTPGDSSNCPYVAGLRESEKGVGSDEGEISVRPSSEFVNETLVQTRDSSGAPADKWFHLILYC